MRRSSYAPSVIGSAVTTPSVRLAMVVFRARTIDGAGRQDPDLADSRHVSQRLLGRAPDRPLLDPLAKGHDTVRAADADGPGTRDRIGRQHPRALGRRGSDLSRHAGTLQWSGSADAAPPVARDGPPPRRSVDSC